MTGPTPVRRPDVGWVIAAVLAVPVAVVAVGAYAARWLAEHDPLDLDRYP